MPTPTFASLESAVTTRRASSMATGFVLQAALVSGVLLYAAVAPRFLPTQFSRIELVAPAPDLSPQRSTPTQPEKSAPVHPSIAQPEPQQQAMLVRLPQRVKPAPQPEAVQPVAMPAPNFDARIIHELPSPRQVRAVTSAGFGGSSAAPTLDKVAPSRVQTGGFGDPNGVPLNANGSGRSNIAAVGSFDMPRGAGYGNGTGGAHGARGSVASSGFGNGTAGPGSGTASRGNVQTAAGFNRVAAAPETKRSVLHASTVPVTILSKPSPVYTEAARARRIEGEVLLNVTFSADGRVHVQGILRGLGYGLDEAAVRAVQGMKFTPATRDGHAVDSPAVLHVVFQLS
ncbi:MAG: TonB family protein [Acidobacteriota bacterium]|nr:TonB family protein [Acidobacteriota bacterium]